MDDFNHPVHKVTFITPNAAEVFVNRLDLAVKKSIETNQPQSFAILFNSIHI
jgi:hypothetical protein